MSNDEQLFIRKALASVEKAEKYQRIKQIVVTVLTFGAAIWLTERSPSPELKLEVTILIGVGLIAAICTAKIMTLINQNTKSVLQADCGPAPTVSDSSVPFLTSQMHALKRGNLRRWEDSRYVACQRHRIGSMRLPNRTVALFQPELRACRAAQCEPTGGY
jgi:hypothetical protein